MNKEVLISISGIQFAEEPEGAEPLETVVAGEYYKRNGAHFVLYDETVEEWGKTIHNFIKIRDNSMEVRKRGLMNTHMIFEPGKKNLTSYQLPFGEVQLGISTTGVKIDEQQDRITAVVNYALGVNEGYIADCEIHLEVRSKEAAADLLANEG